VTSPNAPRFANSDAALSRVEASCAARGIRLTSPRRLVLGLLLDAERPLGVYRLLARLRVATCNPVAPPAVYRALGFPVSQGLAHRIEQLDAFVACSAVAAGGSAHAHAHQFLVRQRCGRGGARPGDRPRAVSRRWARRLRPRSAIIEVEGECARCMAGPPLA
jgi:Fur family zinc uptake transcriptional regulator